MVLISNRELLATASKIGPSLGRTCKLTSTTGWTHWLKTMKTCLSKIQWRNRCTPRFLRRSRWRRTISSAIKSIRIICRQNLFIKMVALKSRVRTRTKTHRLSGGPCENNNSSVHQISSNWKTSRYKFNSSLIELLQPILFHSSLSLQWILNLVIKVKRLKLKQFRRSKTCVTATWSTCSIYSSCRDLKTLKIYNNTTVLANNLSNPGNKPRTSG